MWLSRGEGSFFRVIFTECDICGKKLGEVCLRAIVLGEPIGFYCLECGVKLKRNLECMEEGSCYTSNRYVKMEVKR